MKHKISLSTCWLLLLIGLQANSQTIKGRVLDEDGRPIQGANVNVRNKINTVTDMDGRFAIHITALHDTLAFSMTGYENYRVRVTSKTMADPTFEVVLLRSRSSLSDVVVVGYGKEKRKDVVGSVASAKMFKPSGRSISEVLEGRVPGIAVTDGASSPSMRIRGFSGVASDKSLSNLEVAAGKKIVLGDSLIARTGTTVSRTKLLTAGEINDFNKWKMWEDFTDNEFKTHAQYWRLWPKQRYCVQLQNDAYGPVVGQMVYLLDATTRDTVWRSTTDNTGKAELWAAIGNPANEKDKKYVLSTNNSDDLQRPYPFEKGINKIKIHTACNVSNTVDIAFVVDATGSMGDEIEFLKLELEDVLRNTATQFGDLDLRAASVFYRDRGDAYLTKHVDFHTDFLKTLNFVKLQKADGGGDTPEAVESALQTALDSLTWSSHARTKLLFLILDAPPHDGTQKNLFGLMQKAAANGVRIIPIVCSGADKSTEFLMRSLALVTNGTYVFLTDDSGIGNSHIKPTTDVFNVELLNNLLQRLIKQAVYVPACNNHQMQPPLIKTPDNILNVHISPNPTSGRFFIKSNKPLKEIFVADFTGKILIRLTKGNNSKAEQWDADLGAYPSGTYIVKYITTENEWGAGKVVVVR